MDNYRKLVEQALKAKLGVNESFRYSESHKERMHPQLEKEIKNGNHSLGKHPALPIGDEQSFEEKILSNRFEDVVNQYKKAHDISEINNKDLISGMMPMVSETIELESKFKKQLEELAIKMVREEYNMGEDVVEIIAELTTNIDATGTKSNSTPNEVKHMEFETHDDMLKANDEVYKRRFLNAMTQGAAKKCNHMFHMVDEELTKMNPLLPAKYSKMMSAADYMYYIIPEMDKGVKGGIVNVEFPNETNPKAIIKAQAMVFPVLIHELIKGVMELLSAHGLPEDKKMGQYVIDKADFLGAEPWDMRLGPALWERFTSMMEPEDFNLKHHVYSDLAAMPVKEFNENMREILSGSKKGKQIVGEMTHNIKEDLKKDDYRLAIDEANKEAYFNPDDLDDLDISSLFK